MGNETIRHLCGLSGGKDSAALAIYLRDKVPNMEYFFCDTGYELPEVYEFLNRLEAYLGKPIVRLDNGGRDFEHYLVIKHGYLPSPQNRWCTEVLKLRPMELFIGHDKAINYVALRADENREGYTSKKPNIKSRFPFIEDGLTIIDIHRILDSVSLGLPKYYEWRSRSGCFFCFYQRKIEWIRLFKLHPDLFKKAVAFEEFAYKLRQNKGQDYKFSWLGDELLIDMVKPERMNQIIEECKLGVETNDKKEKSSLLVDIFK
jgi:hypothetical protein